MLQVSGRQVIRALERAGWVRMRSTGGSHVKLRRANGTGRVIVPDHGAKPLKLGTVRQILAMAGMTQEELEELL
jgi:predicted RNA binding protein YcfA (HicA-like mRNA interferase family)